MVFRHGSCCGTRVATWVSSDCFRPRRGYAILMSEPSVDPTRREQRTADSRQRILDAAVECLIENGYHAA